MSRTQQVKSRLATMCQAEIATAHGRRHMLPKTEVLNRADYSCGESVRELP